MACDLYDILQVPQHATLDEIKFAFKRRALQVHPDKGGSKDAFHKVYQALEILSDPEARKKHDQRLMGAKEPQMHGRGPVPAGKTKNKKQTHHSKSKKHGPENKPPRPAASTKASTAAARLKAKLMMKIQLLLKQLPREVRFQAISQDFSQKQRVLLQKWMVDNAAEKCEESQADQAADADPVVFLGTGGFESQWPLAIFKGFQRPKQSQGAQKESKTSSNRAGTKGLCRRGSGGREGSGRYRANVVVDGLSICSRNCDLPTALEYLVILTSAKQQALEGTNSESLFEDCLDRALVSAAKEHEKGLDELKLRFCVLHHCSLLIGRKNLQSPVVQSLEDVKRLRKCMEPIGHRVKHCKGFRYVFDFFSPQEVQELWEQFQAAVTDMCQAVGADSTKCLRQIQSWHDATDRLRTKHLQLWEVRRMATNDRQKHAKHLRKNTMRRAARLYSLNDPVSCKLTTLRMLLRKWGHLLAKEAQTREKQRLKILEQRKRQRAKKKTSHQKRFRVEHGSEPGPEKR